MKYSEQMKLNTVKALPLVNKMYYIAKCSRKLTKSNGSDWKKKIDLKMNLFIITLSQLLRYFFPKRKFIWITEFW